MTATDDTAVQSLRVAMDGPVIDRADADYDDARRVWNAAIDTRPAVIARCLDEADVRRAVAFAVEHELEIAVRGGAHSMSGASSVEGGLVIDLGAMSQVIVDPEASIVRVGGGALLGDLDAATQVHGLAVPAGLVSHTGVAGLTLGGGMGWLTRQAGLTVDNLLSARVVTADGRIVRADADENGDLFWALRGGGGNFGVVTEFEFRLHPVGPTVSFGLLFWDEHDGPEVLRLARETMASLPREINIVTAALNAPPADFVPEQHRLQAGYALLVAGFGSPSQHERVVDQLRTALPPLFEVGGPMPYVELQKMLDEANRWGLYCYEKSSYVEELSDAAISVITEQVPHKASPLSLLLLYRLDGAYCALDDETAFGGDRSPRYSAFIVGVCPTPELLGPERGWVRSFWDALRPHTAGIGAYVNAMTEQEQDRVMAAYGPAKYQRLARIKGAYDPANVFRRNVNIAPAVGPR